MLLIAAGLFAAFTGYNDAGALVGIGLRNRGIRPVVGLLVLVAAVVAAPLVIGVAVATTLDERLVSFDGGRQWPLLVGILTAVLVTGVLAFRRLPTSLTLALIGGISGAGLGTRAAVDWTVVGLVLLAAAAAPFVGAFAALLVCRLLAALPAPEGAARRLRWLHVGAYTASCVAYGANDGQKMIAVYAALYGGGVAAHATSPAALALIAGCFLLGAVFGLQRLAASIGGGLAASRTDTVVVTEATGAGVVLGTALLGAPVSMTQSLSGAMIGTGLARKSRRVRWRSVLRLGTAWLLTLPTAMAVAAAAGAALSVRW
ncbi:inorganic phosphate transporter [Polymorphospora rubra]|uniref:inorganic phosphate transporter n=1 Tax=Polymorphospora rubra TaxID=338584 RepID=UPI0033FA8D57